MCGATVFPVTAVRLDVPGETVDLFRHLELKSSVGKGCSERMSLVLLLYEG